jgi:hypothetical protein
MLAPSHREGAYEIWHGQAPSRRPVTMVLLGAQAAQDPSARRAFADAAEWARVSADQELQVLGGDPYAATPWVALVPDGQGRGVARFLDRLFGGPPTEAGMTVPLPRVFAANAGRRSDATAAQAAAAAAAAQAMAPGMAPGATQSGMTLQDTMNISALPISPVSPPSSPAPPPPVRYPPPAVAAPPPAPPVVSAPPAAPAPSPVSALTVWPPASPPPAPPPVPPPPVPPPPMPPRPPQMAPRSPQMAPRSPQLGPRPPQVAPRPPQVNQATPQVAPPHPPAGPRPPLMLPRPRPGGVQQASRRWVLLGIVALVVLGGGAAAVLWTSGAGRGTPDANGSSSSVPRSPTPAPSLPTYRADAPPALVLGPTFSAQDTTKVQTFPDWPFAFRTTAEMVCNAGSRGSDAATYSCRQAEQPKHVTLALVLRKATSGCDAAEQSQLERLAPTAPGSTFVAAGPVTRYADTSLAASGRTQFTLVHCFGGGGGRSPTSAVIYQGNAPTDQRGLILKIANDIRSQTG